MTGRGVIGDKWGTRLLWLCTIGSAIAMYMVSVERQAQNRERRMAENFEAMEFGASDGDDV